MSKDILIYILYGGAGVLALILFIVLINFFSIWIRALFSGARVTYTELIALRLRNVRWAWCGYANYRRQSGLEVTIDDLSTHYLAGGNIEWLCCPSSPRKRPACASISTARAPLTSPPKAPGKQCSKL